MTLEERTRAYAQPFATEDGYSFSENELLGFVRLVMTVEDPSLIKALDTTQKRKIDKSVADEIRDKIATKALTQAQAARAYNISQSLVSAIWNRRAYV